MIDLVPPFRCARPDDADRMAEFVNMAGEGLPLYLWSKIAKPGEDPWEIGRQRARREAASFSYRNTVLMEMDGETVACLVSYALPPTPAPIDRKTMPAMFVPMQELENLAPGTWHVNVLATRPSDRGKGYGARLLQIADRIAADAKLKALSIIVNGSNAGARRLYERSGYREAARRTMVKESWQNGGEHWALLTKAV